MGNQVHFIVYYDETSGFLIRDDDTAKERFGGTELIFNTTTEEWEDIHYHPGLDEEAGRAMDTALELYNYVMK